MKRPSFDRRSTFFRGPFWDFGNVYSPGHDCASGSGCARNQRPAQGNRDVKNNAIRQLMRANNDYDRDNYKVMDTFRR